MWKAIEKVLDKIPFENIIAVAFFGSALLLFIPDKILLKIYLLDFRNSYGFAIGIIFLISLIFILIYGFKEIIKPAISKVRIRGGVKRVLNDMDDKYEINIIANFLKSKSNTLMLEYNNGSVLHLSSSGLIQPVRATNAVNITNPIIAYFMQPIVYKVIRNDVDLSKKFSKITEKLNDYEDACYY